MVGCGVLQARMGTSLLSLFVLSVGRRSRGNHGGNTCEVGALHVSARFPKCRSNVDGGRIL
jgi:hypothetical protein